MAKPKFESEDLTAVRNYCSAELARMPLLQKILNFCEQVEPFDEQLRELQSKSDDLTAKIAAKEKALADLVHKLRDTQAELEKVNKELFFSKSEYETTRRNILSIIGEKREADHV
jgi:peptidoglycan hydrolase CwlO-like protein